MEIDTKAFTIIFPCCVGIFFQLLYISRLVIQSQLTKAKDKFLLNVFVSSMVTNIGLILMSLTTDNCFVSQGLITFGFNSTISFSIYYLYYEYLYLKSSTQHLTKRKPSSLFMTLVIHILSFGLGLISIFQIGGENIDGSENCFMLVNSSFINKQYVLVICHLVPLITGIILMTMQLYNIAVRLQRKYFIVISSKKILLPTFCLLFYFTMGIQVTLQLCYPVYSRNPSSIEHPDAYRTEMWRQFGLYALSSYGILYSIFQIIFNRKKNLPIKKFQSFSSTHDDVNYDLGNSKPKSLLCKHFLSDDEELPGEQIKLNVSTKLINS